MSEADLRCYHHPGREATSQCDRCGDYLCSECVHEHDELHVCTRCLDEIRPRGEIAMSGKAACVINALACYFWLLLVADLLFSLVLPISALSTTGALRKLAPISMIMSVVAVLLALSDMRGRANG